MQQVLTLKIHIQYSIFYVPRHSRNVTSNIVFKVNNNEVNLGLASINCRPFRKSICQGKEIYVKYQDFCNIFSDLCAIWYHLYNLENVKNTNGG